ncbi:MAG TPA: sigma-54 dependent transcriptional regulator [Thermoanaerobaculia bacterium]|jgi:DNA-binding NtrC family response regulator|nr:sigma-54 dependent transcriptional regulator [Thermoanaerobaculia bacterium]
MLHALVVDDDAHSLSALAELVEAEGFDTATADNLAQARQQLEKHVPDVVLSDLMLPDGRGTELLKELLEEPTVEVILITGKATVETAVEALRLGAFDYLTKPIDLGRLKTLLARVKDTRELKQEVSSLRAELRDLGRFGPMVGTAPAMQRVYDLIDKVAPTEVTAFLIGESGTGKELAAETIHRLSKRRKGPYLPLNCGAISPTLIESELFGHEKGSFTGAQRQHRGYFERASGGSLFLDEITEMPIELQVKLLRVLETGRIMRVGGDREVEVNVRVITATNRSPDEAMKDGKLREDLFYRLKVFPIQLPPLREREGDIETLANYFLHNLNKREATQKRFSVETMERLRTHHWPGNVRELQNVVQRAFILGEQEITPDCLPAELGGEAPMAGPHLHLKVGTSLEDAERRLILATLDQYEGDKKVTAEVLGISLKTLYNRLNQYAQV